MKLTALLLATGGFLALAATSSSAMPIGNLGAQVSGDVQQARLVCNRWGRCWHTRRHYHPYRYYGRRYYGPAYGYYPGYYRPYGYYGRPGFGFSFRF
jgi:hypothetical protein